MAHKLYGKKLPAVVETRLTKELKNIINHGYSSVFLIWHTLVKKIHERGYHTIPYKFIASSFVAYLVKITDINPLPPHWRCPECQYSEFVTDGTYMFGTDLPNRDCPHCGKRLVKDGYDMPYEIFFGDDHIKSTEAIEIGFPYERKDAVLSHIKQILGQDKVFHLG
jgi:DNA polymerase-3 subunit alpha (Gram-positive type)